MENATHAYPMLGENNSQKGKFNDGLASNLLTCAMFSLTLNTQGTIATARTTVQIRKCGGRAQKKKKKKKKKKKNHVNMKMCKYVYLIKE
ncbi:hypothetical protein POVWA1_049950 [Plasmodium ovale wallikeri]|uniref:Uncharacterized protein n=1 Tax=Plasmodium ovale wallikeri TaxID=864142 RepID=A0A1A8ZKR8_PLAOA|nr:hypothetical protein POVWA1_049950 [Plasmodium ovale wallikeri]